MTISLYSYSFKKSKLRKTQSLGLGTAAIGRPQYINIRQQQSEEQLSLSKFRLQGLALLDSAYNNGIRYFDTAPGYGIAEQLLIDWLKEKQDPTIEVATKWGYTYVANFDKNATVHEVKEHSINKLNEQWNQSQKLLPFLTTYQIHSATLETGVLENQEVLHRLAELKNEHHLKIGLSTTGANQVEVLKKALNVEVDGVQLFEVFQITYNVFDQSASSTIQRITNENKRVVIKEALANGRVFPNPKYSNYSEVYLQLSNLAEKYNVGIDAIALRFCIDSVPVFKVLCGASLEQHLDENLKMNTFQLEESEVALLESLQVNPEKYWQERKQLDWN